MSTPIRPSCESTRRLVPRYLDGELEEERARPLRQHLLDCPSCRELVKGETGLKRWFVAGEAPAVPEGFAARVAAMAAAGATPSSEEPGPDVLTPVAPRTVLEPVPELVRDTNQSESPALVAPTRFVLGLTAVAAAVLLVFALALRAQSLPSEDRLQASPRRSVAEMIEQAEREQAQQRQVPQTEDAEDPAHDLESREGEAGGR